MRGEDEWYLGFGQGGSDPGIETADCLGDDEMFCSSSEDLLDR